MPAKYVCDYMFQAQNLRRGFAASTMMLITVAIIIIPWAHLEFGGRKTCLMLLLSTAASGKSVSGESGPKPKRVISLRNIVLYGTLFVAAAYYLLPTTVLIHRGAGNLLSAPSSILPQRSRRNDVAASQATTEPESSGRCLVAQSLLTRLTAGTSRLPQ